ncbi:unnamed protein product [Rotaria magnacalcarata]|uniref:DUF2383 domain-containing protein n=3 Tax=Rotaria magnacalcarata TaxID=392030 RepID=A0A819GN90_9BILA|nr:unnamed protein product [Rotaria magnacalcarata]CAF2082007.1 unnamed protein product [Rotaria magnacalcarata]CAF2092278.1 unnamed protein product [Rotaria magnacalcarata]CAF2122181.1 unnamed protein product [Rotaria magnacalcarata]CAF3814529.1 unnamed protein product [Rotaria magnacalcarata]
MSSNITTETFATQIAFDEAVTIHRRATEKCQIVLETLYDSYNGYKQCGEDCEDVTLKSLFQRIAASRADLIVQLSNAIQDDLSAQPIKSGSAIAAAHRTWIDIKAWFTDGRDKSVIITEVHRGEQILIKFYEAALEDQNILPKVRDLLHEQLTKVKEQNLSINTI